MPSASGPDVRHALFRRRVDAWLGEDLDAYMECWADDMVIDLPSGRIVGKERYRTLVQALSPHRYVEQSRPPPIQTPSCIFCRPLAEHIPLLVVSIYSRG